PEQLCDLAGITPGDLIGVISKTIWDTKSAASGIISAMAHPRVVERTALYAQRKDGYKDRELFFRATGSLPDKKGSSVVINNNPQIAAVGGMPSAQMRVAGELPDMDQEVVSLSKLLGPAPETLDLRPQQYEAVAVGDDGEDEDAGEEDDEE